MQVVSQKEILGKKVILRYDIDVALSEVGYQKSDIRVKDDFKLKAGLETLKLCIANASKVIIMGHLGRPFKIAIDEKNGNPEELSAKPIQEWFNLHLPGAKAHLEGVFFAKTLKEADQSKSKIVLLENVRFFHGEVPGAEYHATCESKTCDVDFAHKLASLGEVFVNEAFSAHNVSASTTIVPTLLPHYAGLRFVREVRILREVRDNPKKPFIAIMGGAKVKDKLPVITVLAKGADAVLVGGKLIHEISEQKLELPENVKVGSLNEDGLDISSETASEWSQLISGAAMIVWNGPLGKTGALLGDGQQGPYWEMENLGSAKGSYEIAKMIIESNGEIVVGGGDTIAFLNQVGLLEKYQQKAFVSVGGGAMLKLISDGTLPTIEALS